MYLIATEAQHENPTIPSLDTNIGTRSSIQLISLWKKCCFRHLVQANMLDPIAFTFSASIMDRVTLTQQQDTQYEWLHYYDLLNIGSTMHICPALLMI